jgi:calmodulin
MGGFEYLNETQIGDYKDAFNKFGDLDGTVSTRELGPMLQYLGQNPTLSELQEMANDCDNDGSGSVDFPEFLHMMAKQLVDIDSEVRDRYRVYICIARNILLR